MKKFSLFAFLTAAMMTACTDYHEQIESAHQEFQSEMGAAFGNVAKTSGCQCAVLPLNLSNDGNYYFYDYQSRGSGSIFWRVHDCLGDYTYTAELNSSTVTNNEAGAYIASAAFTGLYFDVEMGVTVGGPYDKTNVAPNVLVWDSDGSLVETVGCPAIDVYGVTENSSSSSVPEPTMPTGSCGDLWCGLTDTEGRVDTGFPEEESSGWWFEYTDANDGGSSSFTYPADVSANEYDNFFGPLIEAYGGIKGTVVIGNGYDYPYAGLGFNLVSDSQKGTKISDWEGVCLSYQSTLSFSIELVVEDEAFVTEFNNYKASVPKSSSMTVADFPWAKFKQEVGWGKKVSQESVLAKVATIKLKFSGVAGTSGDFLIQGMGRFGKCN